MNTQARLSHALPRTLLASALSLAASLAQADGVTIYGLLDVAIEHYTNADAQGHSMTRMPNLTGTAPSRIGLKGSEDLGGGWAAEFNLESGIALDSGSLNNGQRMWGRAANVGLATPYGRVLLGRQATMLGTALSTHVMGPGLYAIGSHDSYLPNAFADNAMGYQGRFGAWMVGATYSLGRDTATSGGPAATSCAGESSTDQQACREWSAVVKYDQPGWGLAVAQDTLYGGTGATLGLSSSDYSDSRMLASGWVQFGDVKLSGGLLHRERRIATTTITNLAYLGLRVPLSAAVTLDTELSRMNTVDSPNDSTLLAVRATYAFSKRTAVYATAGRMLNAGQAANPVSAGGTVVAGMDQTGVAAGLRITF
jgi:predicted porin